MSLQLVTVNFATREASITPAISQHRDEIVEAAESIEIVNGDAGQEAAARVLKDLSELCKLCEKSRTEIKAPFLEIGKLIDQRAKEFSAPIEKQISRLKRLSADYQLARIRKEEEERRKREEEAQRAEQERQKAILESAAANAEGNPEAARVAEQKVQQAEQAIIQTLVVPSTPKPEGISARPVWKAEVLNPAEAYAKHPEWFELKPRLSVINAAINSETNPVRECPGVRIYEDVAIRVP